MNKNINIVVEQDLCMGCGTCVSVCPEHCISLFIDKAKDYGYLMLKIISVFLVDSA